MREKMKIFLAVSDFFINFALTKSNGDMITRRDFFERQVELMNDAEYYAAWNRHCEVSRYPDDVLHQMEEFNDMYKGKTPLEILDSVSHVQFNTGDDYFVVDCYSARSDSDPKYLTEESELVDDMCENPSRFSEWIDEDDYTDYIFEEFGTTEEYERFMGWFDENHSGEIYEFDFGELLKEFKADTE